MPAFGTNCPLLEWTLRLSSSRPIYQCHRPTELILTLLPLLLGDGEHRLEQGDQLALRRRHDRVRDLRLLPEDLPVPFLSRLHAVELRLPRAAMTRRKELSQRNVDRANPRRVHRIGAPKPAFFRQTTSFAKTPSSARLSTYFRFSPRSFKRGGMRAAISIISRFRNGTRTSRFAAIDVLSVVIRLRHGRNVFRSTYRSRLSGAASAARAK